MFVAIAAGAGHGLALCLDGVVVGWGVTTMRRSPLPRSRRQTRRHLGGERHSLALNASGKVVCLGNNSFGRRTFPRALPTSSPFKLALSQPRPLRGDGVLLAGAMPPASGTFPHCCYERVMALSAGDGHSAAAIALGGLPQFLGLARSLSRQQAVGRAECQCLGALPFGLTSGSLTERMSPGHQSLSDASRILKRRGLP